ncbi:DUF934 domain-containing protein [Pseudahrensia aquimaris]|uniref:DUF934 domain-containing protein n=1 Tax=Pseudahrensia aquimaris TaxID=744461 RepID=A0ABW3FCZ9_9HYPH
MTNTIITQGRFTGTHLTYIPLADVSDLAVFSGNLDISSDTDPALIVPHLARLKAVRIAFPSSADGRGNSIAKRLRAEGYRGPIRAFGHVHADQYPLALRNGFTDVEIEPTLANRQPEALWTDSHSRLNHTYLERLKTGSEVLDERLAA